MRLLMMGLLLSPAVIAQPVDLSTLFDAAEKNNPSLVASQAAIEAAEANVDAAAAALKPSVTASAGLSAGETVKSASPNRPTGGFSSAEAGLNARLVLWGDSEKAGVSSAEAGSAAALAAAKTTHQGLTFDVADAYLDVLAAQADSRAAKAQLDAANRQLEQAQQRLEVGLGTRVDVDRTQAVADNQAVAVIRARDALAQSYDRLEQLTRIRASEVLDLRANYSPQPAGTSLEAVTAAALDANPQIAQLRSAVAQAQAGVAQAQAASNTRVELSGGYNIDESLSASSDATHGYSATLSVTKSLFTSGGNEAGVEAALAKLREAQANLENTELEIIRQARSLYRSLATQIETVRAQAQSIRSAETAVEANQSAYDVGSGDIVDVLNAQSELFTAQANFAKARYDHARLTLQLEQLMGDLDGADIQTLNQQLQGS